jgi:hypothetical protein
MKGYRGSRGVVPFFIDLCSRRRVANLTPRLLCHQERTLVPIEWYATCNCYIEFYIEAVE